MPKSVAGWDDAEPDWLCEAVSADADADADDALAEPDEEPPEQPARAIAPAVAPMAAALLTNVRREIIDMSVSSFGKIKIESILLSLNGLKRVSPSALFLCAFHSITCCAVHAGIVPEYSNPNLSGAARRKTIRTERGTQVFDEIR